MFSPRASLARWRKGGEATNPGGKEFGGGQRTASKHYRSDTGKSLPAHSGVEAVILATPHSLHSEQIDRAVAARKHIFSEKPLALTKKGAEIAVEACAKYQLVLGMGHERRSDPPWLKCWLWRVQGSFDESNRSKAISAMTSSPRWTQAIGGWMHQKRLSAA